MRLLQKLAGIAGVIVCCIYGQTLAAVLFVIAVIGILAVLWVDIVSDVKAEEKFEHMVERTEYRVWWNSAVVLGKGYDDNGL